MHSRIVMRGDLLEAVLQEGDQLRTLAVMWGRTVSTDACVIYDYINSSGIQQSRRISNDALALINKGIKTKLRRRWNWPGASGSREQDMDGNGGGVECTLEG